MLWLCTDSKILSNFGSQTQENLRLRVQSVGKRATNNKGWYQDYKNRFIIQATLMNVIGCMKGGTSSILFLYYFLHLFLLSNVKLQSRYSQSRSDGRAGYEDNRNNFISSAHMRIFECCMTDDKSLRYKEKRREPRCLPWKPSDLSMIPCDMMDLNETLCTLCLKHEIIQLRRRGEAKLSFRIRKCGTECFTEINIVDMKRWLENAFENLCRCRLPFAESKLSRAFN